MEDNESSLQFSKTIFLSFCMTRSDILFVVLNLATKSYRPTEDHLHMLRRVLQYLRGKVSKKLMMTNSDLDLTLFADASYGIHRDG